MAESAKSEDDNKSFKMGVGIWVSFCIFLCIWLLSRFVRGRRQLRNNLHVIEDGLKRLQDEIDRRQRENSITYGAGTEEIADLLKQLHQDRQERATEANIQKIEDNTLIETLLKTKSNPANENSEELLDQDKKND